MIWVSRVVIACSWCNFQVFFSKLLRKNQFLNIRLYRVGYNRYAGLKGLLKSNQQNSNQQRLKFYIDSAIGINKNFGFYTLNIISALWDPSMITQIERQFYKLLRDLWDVARPSMNHKAPRNYCVPCLEEGYKKNPFIIIILLSMVVFTRPQKYLPNSPKYLWSETHYPCCRL